MQQVEASIVELTPLCTPQLKDYLTTRMDELDKRWTDVLRLSKAKHDGYVFKLYLYKFTSVETFFLQ